MGANATTFVPAYVSGEILTAEDLSVTNSGIPVFATTVTRDAAFGGTGEKTLAEGQFAYIEATNITQYYDGAAWLALGGKIAQVVQATTATLVSTSSTSFVTSGLSATITPSSTSSKVYAVVTWPMNTAGGAHSMFATLFRGTVAGTNLAITAIKGFACVISAQEQSCALNYLDSPSTTSAQVYTLGIRVTSSTGYFCGEGSTAVMNLFEVLA